MARSNCSRIQVVTSALITFNPEALNTGFQSGGFQSDAAQRQQENSEKQDLAGVGLYEAAESIETPLQLPANPNGTSAAGCLVLHTPTSIHYHTRSHTLHINFSRRANINGYMTVPGPSVPGPPL